MTNEQNGIIESIRNLINQIRENQLDISMLPAGELIKIMGQSIEEIDKSDAIATFTASSVALMNELYATRDSIAVAGLLEMMVNLLNAIYARDEYYSDREKKYKLDIEKASGQFCEIYSAYLAGKLDDEFITSHSNEYLLSVKKMASIKIYKEIYKTINEKNWNRIRNKDRIKVAFIIKESAEWCAESLYQLLIKDDRYEVTIVVVPYIFGNGDIILKRYKDTLNYFSTKNYHVIGAYDENTGMALKAENIGRPDIMFNLNPYHRSYGGAINIFDIDMGVINYYIPYSMGIWGLKKTSLNEELHWLCEKDFCETKKAVELAEKYSDLGIGQYEYSGYPKLDVYYQKESNDSENIWKIKAGVDKDKVKKIIYAPHWSIGDTVTGFGNFDKLYADIYEYIKNHADTTSWILRPHPALRAGVAAKGVFDTEDGYDRYLEAINSLPNARVIEGGTYDEMFITSDAMVLDSISFIAEYLYVNKPMLFLTRDTQTFNEFGQELIDSIQKSSGDNIDGITKFIDDVVIGGVDMHSESRKAFFKKHMDYYEINGMLAGEYIYNYLKGKISSL